MLQLIQLPPNHAAVSVRPQLLAMTSVLTHDVIRVSLTHKCGHQPIAENVHVMELRVFVRFAMLTSRYRVPFWVNLTVSAGEITTCFHAT